MKTFGMCKTCKKLKPKMFPKAGPRSFYAKPTLLSRPIRKDGSRKGEIRWEILDKHQQTAAHLHASSLSKANLMGTFVKRKSDIELVEESNFQDDVIFAVVNDCTPDQACQRGRMLRYRGSKHAKADKKDAWRITDSVARVLKDQNSHVLERSFATQLSLDDGSSVDVREWCAITMSADPSAHSDITRTSNFMFGLIQLHWDELDASGMLSVLEELDIDWDKLFWVGRDGASVMKALFQLIKEHKSPFAFDEWCNNHLNALLMKDCVFGIPEFSSLVDYLSKLYKFIRYSNKSKSRLQDLLPENHRGAQTPKRAEKLTRWTALKTCSAAMLALYPFLLEVMVMQLNDPAEIKNSDRHKSTKEMFEFWCSFKNMAILTLLLRLGKAFVKFHEALEARATDFTVVNREVKLLKRAVNLCLKDETQKAMVREVLDILEKSKTIENFTETEEKYDVFVRVHETNRGNIAAVLLEYTHNFVDIFAENVDTRFPSKEDNEIIESFRIFDKDAVPNPLVEGFDDLIEDFGKDELKCLLNWYGTSKKLANGTIVPPKIDTDKALEQWPSFVHVIADLYHKKNVNTILDLTQRLVWREQHEPFFQKHHSEPLKFLKICSIIPRSTSEVERVISTLNRVMSDFRTSLSSDHLESCVLISHESRRRYGPAEKFKIIDLLPEAQEILKEKRKEHSRLNVESLKNAKAKKQQNQQESASKKRKPDPATSS